MIQLFLCGIFKKKPLDDLDIVSAAKAEHTYGARTVAKQQLKDYTKYKDFTVLPLRAGGGYHGRDFMKTVTVSQMKQIEKNAAESGLSYTQMMENAGARAADFLLAQTPPARSAVVFAGKGNNAGDGFVAARLLKKAGCEVTVVLTDGLPQTADTCRNLEKIQAMGIPVFDFLEETAAVTAQLKNACVAVDAIYGTGFHGALRQSMRLVTEVLNAGGRSILALDMPSGVSADTGEVSPGAVRATWTMAFDSLKPAHLLEKSIPFCGEIVPVDIGIPAECHEILE